MKAMILAAGLGTRLLPLTEKIPKALIEINGKPMIEWQIENLKKWGFHDIIINIHHFANLINDFIISKNTFGINIQFSDETDRLLDTGGGLKKASWFFDDDLPMIVQNVDIFTNINYNELIEFHNKNDALVTLVVKNRNSSRYLLFNDENILCGWENRETNEKILTRKEANLSSLAFSGINVINPAIFELISEQGAFSLIDLYLRLSESHQIKSFNQNDDLWFDLGKISSLEEFIKLKPNF